MSWGTFLSKFDQFPKNELRYCPFKVWSVSLKCAEVLSFQSLIIILEMCWGTVLKKYDQYHWTCVNLLIWGTDSLKYNQYPWKCWWALTDPLETWPISLICGEALIHSKHDQYSWNCPFNVWSVSWNVLRYWPFKARAVSLKCAEVLSRHGANYFGK